MNQNEKPKQRNKKLKTALAIIATLGGDGVLPDEVLQKSSPPQHAQPASEDTVKREIHDAVGAVQESSEPESSEPDSGQADDEIEKSLLQDVYQILKAELKPYAGHMAELIKELREASKKGLNEDSIHTLHRNVLKELNNLPQDSYWVSLHFDDNGENSLSVLKADMVEALANIYANPEDGTLRLDLFPRNMSYARLDGVEGYKIPKLLEDYIFLREQYREELGKIEYSRQDEPQNELRDLYMQKMKDLFTESGVRLSEIELSPYWQAWGRTLEE